MGVGLRAGGSGLVHVSEVLGLRVCLQFASVPLCACLCVRALAKAHVFARVDSVLNARLMDAVINVRLMDAVLNVRLVDVVLNVRLMDVVLKFRSN